MKEKQTNIPLLLWVYLYVNSVKQNAVIKRKKFHEYVKYFDFFLINGCVSVIVLMCIIFQIILGKKIIFSPVAGFHFLYFRKRSRRALKLSCIAFLNVIQCQIRSDFLVFVLFFLNFYKLIRTVHTTLYDIKSNSVKLLYAKEQPTRIYACSKLWCFLMFFDVLWCFMIFFYETGETWFIRKIKTGEI
jgi:hypothetical protein